MKKSARITVLHTEFRREAERWAKYERELYPTANVTVSGEQGKWKVRRDRQPDDG